MQVEVLGCKLMLSTRGDCIYIMFPKTDGSGDFIAFGIPSNGWNYEEMYQQLSKAIREKFLEAVQEAMKETEPLVAETLPEKKVEKKKKK